METPIAIGKVVGVFGLKGFLKIWPDTDFPERFDEGRMVIIDGQERRIRETRWHKLQVRIRIDGVTRIEQAEALIGQEVYVPADATPELDEDEFMIDDLIGLKVFDTTGKLLGTLDEVHRGAQDVYQVGEALVPAVKEFIKEVDIAGGRMVIDPLESMFSHED
jgi:16S rRNA processing protein RimM